MIDEKDEMYGKLVKLKKPKAPEGVMDIANPAFFSIKPRDSLKTYYFGVPSNERSLWIGYMNDARDGMNRFREALRLKRGATASVSSSSAALFGNLQPIGSNANNININYCNINNASNTLSSGFGVGGALPGSPHSPSSSISSTESSLGGSYTSFGPSSGRSFQSTNSVNSSASARSNTTNSSSSGTSGVRQTTIESGTMPGTLAHHSASAPPARQFNVVSPTASTATLSPRSRLEEDPFGLAVHHQTSPTAELSTHSSPTLGTTMSSSPSYNHSPAINGYENVNGSSAYNSQLGASGDQLIVVGASSSAYASSPAVIVTSPSHTSISPVSTSPAPTGTAVLTVLPQPVLFSNQNSMRDSFVFDAM